MKIVSPDEGELNKERSEAENRKLENDKRDRYLKDLRKDEDFQRYVVDGILKEAVEKDFCLDRIPVSDDLDNVGRITLQYKLAAASLNKIIKKLNG